MYPGNYEEFLWSKRQRSTTDDRLPIADGQRAKANVKAPAIAQPPKPSFEEKRRVDAQARKARKDAEARQKRIDDLEARIAQAETNIKDLEAQMAAPGFYDNHETSKPVIDRHQALMWEVGDLMNKWEALQADTKV